MFRKILNFAKKNITSYNRGGWEGATSRKKKIFETSLKQTNKKSWGGELKNPDSLSSDLKELFRSISQCAAGSVNDRSRYMCQEKLIHVRFP